MDLKHFIGVDVSKATLDLVVCEQDNVVYQTQLENTKKSIAKVIKALRKLDGFSMNQSVFCMEHTGIYCHHLLDYLHQCKANIWLESATRIKKSQGLTRGKDDSLDAARISNYAFTHRNRLQLWHPGRNEIIKLKQLITMRDRLKNCLKRIQTPMEENKLFLDKEAIKLEKSLFKDSVKALKKDLKSIEYCIDELIDQDPRLKQLFQLTTSVDGVGPITAINIITVTNEFMNFTDPNKFATYSGVAPFPNRSGTSLKGRMRVSHLANKKIKMLLHLAAMSSIKMKGELQDYYQRKVAEGKNKMSVLNAVRNKLIHRIFSVIKRQEMYSKNYDWAIA